jgi:prophage regulatory protein
MSVQVYRLKEVRALIGLSTASIYRMVAAGTFPKPIRIGAKAIAWREADLEAWLAEREAA